MAVALHMAPADLLGADDEVLDHLVDITGRERTLAQWRDEVAALTAELVHAVYRVTVQVNQKKGAKPPSPLKVPRPWATDGRPRKPAQARQKLSVAEFFARFGKGD